MTHTKLYLDLRGKAKDGLGSLLLMIFHKYTTASIPLGIRLRPDQWRNDTVINHADAVILNATIAKKKADYDMKLLLLSSEPEFASLTAAQLKSHIVGEQIHKPSKHLVSDIVNDYLQGDLSEGTKIIYRTTLEKIVRFSGAATCIEDVDFKWLRSFDRYLAKTLRPNAKAIYLRDLRTILNYAIHIGIPVQYPFENFQIKTEPTVKKSIPVETLRKFYRYPCTDSQARYRDYFFLMFFLRGISAIDLLTATHTMIKNDRLEYSRTKTHSELLSVKIEPEARVLLEKYKGDRHLVKALDHCQHYKNFLHNMNDALGEIGDVENIEIPSEDLFAEPTYEKKIYPVAPELTSRSARHCWATYAHELGISTDIVGLALGHSTRSRVTWIYIKPDQSSVDEANRKVIDYFLG